MITLDDGTQVEPHAAAELWGDADRAYLLVVKIGTDDPIPPKNRKEFAENVLNALLVAVKDGHGVCPDSTEAFTCTVEVAVLGETPL